jgi:hypothetical protein
MKVSANKEYNLLGCNIIVTKKLTPFILICSQGEIQS